MAPFTPVVSLLNGDTLNLFQDVANLALRPSAGRIWRADACVTDPPYGFDFAGEKEWDSFEDNRSFTTDADDSEQFALFTEKWARAVVMDGLKPGAHLLAFTAGRTIGPVDRGLRRAGLAIPRVLFWLYASGQVKNPNDVRPGCEPIFCGRLLAENLTALFKKEGRGQFHAQTWKAEDGKHPTDVLIDESLVEGFDEVRAIVDAHPGTFFVPKPSPKDRDWGCADLPEVKKDNRLSHMTSHATGKVVKDVMAQNFHPTVKTIDLMRRLVRLVSRPGHTIIDPFMGSGTTGIAAVLEGRNFIGIEREPEFFKIASTRINSAVEEFLKGQAA